MKPRLWLCVILAAGLAAVGCGGGSTTSVSITLSQTTATVFLQQSVQFVPNVTGSTNTVQWSVNNLTAATSTTPSGNSTVGSVTSTGIYTAPNTLPPKGTPAITVTATVQSTSTSASVAITLDSGVRVSVTPTSYTIGTGEQFQFTANVTRLAADQSLAGVCIASNTVNPPPNSVFCNAVTWTATTGHINASTGVYNAPAATTTDTVTATSVFDTNQAASVTVTVSTATDPTITSVSPRDVAAGTLFQDVFITGTNFINTTKVYVDNVALGAPQIEVGSLNSATRLRVRLLDDLNLMPGAHTITVSQQNNGAQQSCTTLALCQLTVDAVRPAIIGAPSVPQRCVLQPSGVCVPQAGGFDIDLDGGYFGTRSNPAVTVKVGGKPESATIHDGISTLNRDRQLSVTINSSDVSLPGLYPVEVDSNFGKPPAIVNLAVQPAFSTLPTAVAGSPVTVGVAPSAVAINAATGVAVVVNQGSSDVTLVDMTQSTPTVVGFICTGAAGQTLSLTETNACPAAGPTAVAVDDVRKLALVANTGTGTIAAIDLTPGSQNVAFILPATTYNPGTATLPTLSPTAVGINPGTGRALIAYQSTNVGVILDLTPWSLSPRKAPNPVGVVNITNGLKTHIAVSPKLNWATVTPGQLGGFSIVDLNRQNAATIASVQSGGAVRVAGTVSSTVTITTTAAHALQVGLPVDIQNVSDSSFNGIYTVTSVPTSNTFTYAQSPSLTAATSGSATGANAVPATASYATSLTTISTGLGVQGVAVNDETQQALLVDPTSTGTPVQVLNLLDQSVTSVTLPTSEQGGGNVAAAFNPLADFAITVNNTTGNATLIDPAHQTLLNSNSFTVGLHPVDVAIDQVTNEAIFVNQGSDTTKPGTVSIFNLGTLRAGPQIVEVSAQPTVSGAVALPGPAVIDGPAVIVGSTLGSGVNQSGIATAVQQTLTITGSGFTGSSKVRLDGSPLGTPSVSANGRQITAVVPATMQLAPHRYAVDVIDSTGVSNASSFTVIQRVDLTQNACSSSGPQPQGVAIDDTNNLVVVTEPGCGNVAVIDLATGTGLASAGANGTVLVGTGPFGVAVLPSAGQAVVANLGSGTASVVDEFKGTVVGTATTDQSPVGVAVDQGSGNALVTANGANVLDVFPVSAPGTPSTNGVGQAPIGVAVDPATHLAAVTNGSSNSNTVSLVDLTGKTGTTTVSGFSVPEGVALDPCNTTSSQTGYCASSGFLVASSTSNQVQSINPLTSVVTPIRVGINPTSVAYNFNSSTLVTTNPLSKTISVVDFIDQTVRAVFSATPSSLFGIAIHPKTNLAVVADTTNNQILLIPLPR